MPRQVGTTPKAVLMVSGHWEERDFTVMSAPRPPMVYDYSGFPAFTYQIKYPAPGSPEVATRVQELLRGAGFAAPADDLRGFDHGTFAPMKAIYPEADVTVLQLSIRSDYDPEAHLAVGRALAPLRDEGVLIMGSGNLVHNLHAYGWGRRNVEPYDWAVRFETLAREALLKGDHPTLINYEALGRDAMLSAPTPDHYLPLIYVKGAQREGDEVSFPVEGFDGGSVSMLAVRFG